MGSGLAHSNLEGMTGRFVPIARDVRITRPFISSRRLCFTGSGHDSWWREITSRYGNRFASPGLGSFIWLQRADGARQENHLYFALAPQLRLTLLSSRAFEQHMNRHSDYFEHGSVNLGRKEHHSQWHLSRPLPHVTASTQLSRLLLQRQEAGVREIGRHFGRLLLDQHQRRERADETQASHGRAETPPLVLAHGKSSPQPGTTNREPGVQPFESSMPLHGTWGTREHEPTVSKSHPLPAEELNRVTNHVMSQINQRLSAYRERTGRS